MTFSRLFSLVAVALVAGCSARSAQAGDPCFHAGSMYSDGGASCQSGRQYKCNNGEWLSTPDNCQPAGAVVASLAVAFL